MVALDRSFYPLANAGAVNAKDSNRRKKNFRHDVYLPV